MRVLAPIICGALLTLSTSAAAQQPEDADAAIRAGAEAWAAAWNAADAAALTALYAEDASIMAPGAEPAVGSAAIEAAFQAAMEASPGSQMAIEPVEVMVADGWAVEIGTFVTNDAEGAHADHGSYVAIWKKVDGAWMLKRDIWNSSMTP